MFWSVCLLILAGYIVEGYITVDDKKLIKNRQPAITTPIHADIIKHGKNSMVTALHKPTFE